MLIVVWAEGAALDVFGFSVGAAAFIQIRPAVHCKWQITAKCQNFSVFYILLCGRGAKLIVHSAVHLLNPSLHISLVFIGCGIELYKKHLSTRQDHYLLRENDAN